MPARVAGQHPTPLEFTGLAGGLGFLHRYRKDLHARHGRSSLSFCVLPQARRASRRDWLMVFITCNSRATYCARETVDADIARVGF